MLEEHVEKILNFEKDKSSFSDNPMKFEMHSWDQSWRKESLEHYSQLGWSFIAEENGELLGYVLAQPILFFNNWTQTLWVEHLSATSDTVGHTLMDVLIRWSKSKHLQKVLLNGQKQWHSPVLEGFTDFEEGCFFHKSTTKLVEADS